MLKERRTGFEGSSRGHGAHSDLALCGCLTSQSVYSHAYVSGRDSQNLEVGIFPETEIRKPRVRGALLRGGLGRWEPAAYTCMCLCVPPECAPCARVCCLQCGHAHQSVQTGHRSRARGGVGIRALRPILGRVRALPPGGAWRAASEVVQTPGTALNTCQLLLPVSAAPAAAGRPVSPQRARPQCQC